MAEDFKPEKYVDEYRRDLMKLIAKKAKAGEVNQIPKAGKSEAPVEKKRSNVIDLSSLLASSLSKDKSASGAKAKPHKAGRKTTHEKPARHRKSA
jgi:DNA end-binding protein Ku